MLGSFTTCILEDRRWQEYQSYRGFPTYSLEEIEGGERVGENLRLLSFKNVVSSFINPSIHFAKMMGIGKVRT